MKHYDVLVVVGHCVRICAAIAAARQGKRTLLIEKQILLGGIATLGRIHWLEPYYDSRGKQIIGGLTSRFSLEAFMLELSAWRTYSIWPVSPVKAAKTS